MEPIKGGSLADIPEEADKLLKEQRPELSTASWAIRFAASQENVQVVLSGMSNMAQMDDNLSYMKDSVALGKVGVIGRRYHSLWAAEPLEVIVDGKHVGDGNILGTLGLADAIPAGGARYGNTGPDDFCSFGKRCSLGAVQRHGKAGDCIRCGQCEKHCPQHLPIRDYLKQVSADLDR